jgi:hypothetical protein
MRRLFVDVLDVAEPDWLVAADSEWSRPPEVPPAGVIAPIWRDPWMAVGSRTFSGDILARLGLGHLLAGAGDRYPKLDLGALVAMHPDLVLLPDEPYPFSAEDGPEAFPGIATSLVSGRSLTWYGPAMVTARADLVGRINAALAAS